jgi:hypothetical protein
MPLTEKQRAARSGAVGASEAGALVGDYLHPYASPASIYARIVHGVERKVGNPAFMGNRLEPWIIDQARSEVGVRVRTTSWTYRHKTLPLVATADAVTLDEPVAIVEAKYVTHWGEDAWAGGPPPWIIDQVQVQMALSGRPLAVVVAFMGGSGKLARYDVPQDLERQGLILNAVQHFAAAHLVPQVPPPVTEPRDMDLVLTIAALEDGEIEARGDLLDAVSLLDARARRRLDAEKDEAAARNLVMALMAQEGAATVLPPYGSGASWRATAVARGSERTLRFFPSRSPKESPRGE